MTYLIASKKKPKYINSKIYFKLKACNLLDFVDV